MDEVWIQDYPGKVDQPLTRYGKYIEMTLTPISLVDSDKFIQIELL